MRKISMRTIIIGMVAGFVLFTPSLSGAQAKGPIKIGFITPLSGAFSASGKDMLSGLQLYLEEIGYQEIGRASCRERV